jgi:hypothetical protein
MSNLRESKQVVEHAECMLGCERDAQDSWKRPEISHSDRGYASRGGARKGDNATCTCGLLLGVVGDRLLLPWR